MIVISRAWPPGLRPGQYTRILTDSLPPDLRDALALIN
jgi:hypothetical protein